MIDAKASIKKRWQKRLPLWIAGLLVFIFLLKHSLIFALGWVIIFILLDEYIKEGYWVKKSDFKKPLTHENIAVIASAIFTIATLLKRKRKIYK